MQNINTNLFIYYLILFIIYSFSHNTHCSRQIAHSWIEKIKMYFIENLNYKKNSK